MNNTRRELGQVYKFLKYIYYSRTDAGLTQEEDANQERQRMRKDNGNQGRENG
jgi:hypothetical protein